MVNLLPSLQWLNPNAAHFSIPFQTLQNLITFHPTLLHKKTILPQKTLKFWRPVMFWQLQSLSKSINTFLLRRISCTVFQESFPCPNCLAFIWEARFAPYVQCRCGHLVFPCPTFWRRAPLPPSSSRFTPRDQPNHSPFVLRRPKHCLVKKRDFLKIYWK